MAERLRAEEVVKTATIDPVSNTFVPLNPVKIVLLKFS